MLAGLVVLGLLFFGVLAVLARLAWCILLLPFQLLGLVLGGVGFVIALPFVILALVIGGVGLGLGALFLFVPILPLVLVVAAIAWLVRRGRRTATAS